MVRVPLNLYFFIAPKVLENMLVMPSLSAADPALLIGGCNLSKLTTKVNEQIQQSAEKIGNLNLRYLF